MLGFSVYGVCNYYYVNKLHIQGRSSVLPVHVVNQRNYLGGSGSGFIGFTRFKPLTMDWILVFPSFQLKSYAYTIRKSIGAKRNWINHSWKRLERFERLWAAIWAVEAASHPYQVLAWNNSCCPIRGCYPYPIIPVVHLLGTIRYTGQAEMNTVDFRFSETLALSSSWRPAHLFPETLIP